MKILVYTSIGAVGLGSADIFRIVEKSAANNSRDELTGFLVFYNQRFMQVVEGPDTALDALLQRLETDERHHSINVVQHGETAKRYFAGWSMRRLPASADYRSVAKTAPELLNSPLVVRNTLDSFLRDEADEASRVIAARSA